MSTNTRFILRAAVLAVFTLSAGPGSGRVGAQDPNLKPNFGAKSLKAGFTPDPFKVAIDAGGDIQTNKGGLAAWVSKAPDFSLEYTTGKYPLTFHVTSTEDTTLLINLPDGKWIADDDSAGNRDPMIRFKAPKTGRYDIWIGTVAKGRTPKAILHITEVEPKSGDFLGDAIDLISGVKRGPFGRPQFNLLDEKTEKEIGAKYYKEMLKKETDNVLSDKEKLVKQVKEVTDRLIKATNDPAFLKLTKISKRNFDYEVRVLRKKEANAFCLPGGKMVFFTGMAAVCKTDAGLAAVMGHEISHALCSHGAENVSQQAALDVGINLASLGKMTEKQREQIREAVNLVAMPVALKYSRMQETEADHVGVLLMAAAGYDPKEAPKLWERMKALSKGIEPPEFLSTHPSHETRIRNLEGWQDEAEPLYKSAKDKVTTPTTLATP